MVPTPEPGRQIAVQHDIEVRVEYQLEFGPGTDGRSHVLGIPHAGIDQLLIAGTPKRRPA
jgi:hypothetical protein